MIPIDTTETEIFQNTDIFERVIDNPHEGIAIINNARTIEYINDRACEILSRPRDEIIGHDFLEFIHPNYSPLLSEKFDIVARYQGGANAGHTVKVGDKTILDYVIEKEYEIIAVRYE